jgi:hypothetical protein
MYLNFRTQMVNLHYNSLFVYTIFIYFNVYLYRHVLLLPYLPHSSFCCRFGLNLKVPNISLFYFRKLRDVHLHNIFAQLRVV